ncbi:MAG: T7 exonuclease, partial [Bacteroidetes bacterium]|nr:T7 exonuclease [Bacteroidota bacterium]
RAIALFEENGYSWKTVVEAFADKNLSEEVALENARLARILTANDYDFTNKQPILWSPTSDYRVDDGTGSKNASN